jgi:hypothetical protein
MNKLFIAAVGGSGRLLPGRVLLTMRPILPRRARHRTARHVRHGTVEAHVQYRRGHRVVGNRSLDDRAMAGWRTWPVSTAKW